MNAWASPGTCVAIQMSYQFAEHEIRRHVAAARLPQAPVVLLGQIVVLVASDAQSDPGPSIDKDHGRRSP